MAVPPAAMLGIVQVNALPLKVTPLIEAARGVSVAGSVSVTTTLVAAAGPLSVTDRV